MAISSLDFMPKLKLNKTIKSKVCGLTMLTALSIFSLPTYACQIPDSYYKYVSCTSSNSYFLASKDSGAPVALIDRNGNQVADLSRYTKVDANKLQNGVMPVMRSGRVGYMSISGREVVPTIYDVLTDDGQTTGWARAANNNRIIVRRGGNLGIIDTNNNIILPFSAVYRSISDYKNSTAKVVKNSEVLWVDLNARRTANPNPKPLTKIEPSLTATSGNQPTTTSTLSSSVITTTTTTSAQTQTTQPTSKSGQDLTKLRSEVWKPEKRDGKWGYVDSNGVPMITFSFVQATAFSEGLAGVRIGEEWGFINLAGELVIPFNFKESDVRRGNNDTYKDVEPFIFNEGKAWVGNAANGAKICIDKEGINVSCYEAVQLLPRVN